MAKSPNAGLAALLREAHWSQRQFVNAVNRLGAESGGELRYDESAVSHWLRGTEPRERVRGLIVEALSRRLSRPVTFAEAGLRAPKVQEAGPREMVDGLVDLGRQDMDPSRRGVLGAALFSVALSIPDWPDVIGRAEAVQAGRSQHIGQGEVRMVQDMTEELSGLDDRYGGRHARPMAATFLVNTVATYLRCDARPEVRRDLLSAASDLCYLTGYMAVDEGLHGLAQRYYLKALELAGAADDHLTYCTTLRGMSVQADLGHSRQAVRLADAAAAASPAAGPRMRAFLAGQQAHSAAQLGESRAALRYLQEAERAMDKAEAGVKTFGSYDPAALYYHSSQVRYELGDVAGALKVMQAADKARDDTYRRTRVHRRALLAERQLEAGRLEDACATWSLALDDYPFVESGKCDAKVAHMFALIRPHQRNEQARELYEKGVAVRKSVA
ncbi:tetratricopeptide repeat protein [Streptomyces sp. NPDC059740]|uniref:tetratricopeptide repeat protein n=1 Tax=Streptomyces sp. NPDC059740 TaxID=3346926 RepID=UPI0036521EB0